jgi:hypothetical protein
VMPHGHAHESEQDELYDVQGNPPVRYREQLFSLCPETRKDGSTQGLPT